jgi:DNA replication protein DnaC
MGGEDHRCDWRNKAERLAAELARVARSMEAAEAMIRSQTEAIRARDAALAKQASSSRRSRPPSRSSSATCVREALGEDAALAEAIRDPDRAEAERIAALQTRRENAEKKRQLVTRRIEHKVPDEQKNKRLARSLRDVKLRIGDACVEDIDYPPRRELEKATIRQLSTCKSSIAGATGTGKTYIACALRSRRAARATARSTAAPISSRSSRTGTASAPPILTSQVPTAKWHDHIGDPVNADSFRDRILHNADRLVLKGPSTRKETSETDK